MPQPCPDIPVVLPLTYWAYILRAPTGRSSVNRHNVSTDGKKHAGKPGGFYPQTALVFCIDFYSQWHSNIPDYRYLAQGRLSALERA